MSYSYLKHIDSEFIADEEKTGEEAEGIMRRFFQKRTGTKSRAFVGEGLRYVITDQKSGLEILEEDGEWQKGVYESFEDNNYEIIYEEDNRVRSEEIDASEASYYFEGL